MKLHTPATLSFGKETSVPIEYETGWSPEPVLYDTEKTILLSLEAQELRIGYPACSQSLYLLRYRGSCHVMSLCLMNKALRLEGMWERRQLYSSWPRY